MSPNLLSAERHSERILAALRLNEPGRSVDDLVTRSWDRCLNDYRLDPGRPNQPTLLARGDLEERQARAADVIESARHEMSLLHAQLADSESAVVLTDIDGVIIHMVASPAFASEAAPLGLCPGAVWSETAAGTNGMGTCLAAARPVAVCREDHFFSQFSQLTCSAVPVFDPSGELAAVLDVTSRSTHMQQHLLVLLGMTARMIENRLIDRRFPGAYPLHFHSRPEFIYTLHEGRLAVTDDGAVVAANRSALFQLGVQTVREIRSRRVEDLFQTSLGELLQRSATSSFHPVVTFRADAHHRFFAVARRPAGDSQWSAPSLASAALAEELPRTLSAARVVAPKPDAGDGAAASVFKDPRLLAHLQTARRVIGRGTPVLLCGETGCGKEVFGRAVHAGSPHSTGAFVAINCASLPESLIEAELFGYRAGAFTGAQRSGRRGKILQADGGTLFLDEIGDMPLHLQARLLRVLDERVVTPLGSEDVHPVDFQLLSASHRHLPSLVREGRFREDLYYRLAGIEIDLPPLRDRSDKRELIRAVLAAESGRHATLTRDAESRLLEHPWPGNLRQLRHVLRSAVALSESTEGMSIGVEQLPFLRERPLSREVGALPDHSLTRADAPAEPAPAADESEAPALNPMQVSERRLLTALLEQHRWNLSKVAKVLDMSRNTLYRKLRKLQIDISAPA